MKNPATGFLARDTIIFPGHMPANDIIDKTCVLNLVHFRAGNKWLDMTAYRNHASLSGASYRD